MSIKLFENYIYYNFVSNKIHIFPFNLMTFTFLDSQSCTFLSPLFRLISRSRLYKKRIRTSTKQTNNSQLKCIGARRKKSSSYSCHRWFCCRCTEIWEKNLHIIEVSTSRPSSLHSSIHQQKLHHKRECQLTSLSFKPNSSTSSISVSRVSLSDASSMLSSSPVPSLKLSLRSFCCELALLASVSTACRLRRPPELDESMSLTSNNFHFFFFSHSLFSSQYFFCCFYCFSSLSLFHLSQSSKKFQIINLQQITISTWARRFSWSFFQWRF